jgi:hypothetical protein
VIAASTGPSRQPPARIDPRPPAAGDLDSLLLLAASTIASPASSAPSERWAALDADLASPFGEIERMAPPAAAAPAFCHDVRGRGGTTVTARSSTPERRSS